MAVTDQPSIVEVLQAFAARRERGINVSLPGRITAFDHATRLATVQLGVQDLITGDLNDGYQTIPPLTGVPIARPRGGGFALSLPHASGDTVHVVFSHSDPSAFRRSGNPEPPDAFKRFGLYACAFPCDWLDAPEGPAGEAGKAILEGPGARLVVDGAAVHVGGDVASDFLALSTKVDTIFQTLHTLFTTGWVVVPMDGGAALKTAYGIAFGAGIPSVAATKAKGV